MVAWEASRTRIPIESRFEVAELARPVGKLDACASTNRPIASADALARLQHGAVISGLAEFVCRRETGNAGTQDHDLGPVRTAALKRDRLGDRGEGEETHRLHGQVGRPIAPG